MQNENIWSIIGVLVVTLVAYLISRTKRVRSSVEVESDDSHILFIGASKGKPIIGSIISGLQTDSRSFEYPWIVRVGIEIKEMADNGWPTGDENRILGSSEEAIETELVSATRGEIIPLGHIHLNGFRDVWFAVKDPEVIHAVLKEIIDSKKYSRPFHYEIKKDENWNNLRTLLEFTK